MIVFLFVMCCIALVTATTLLVLLANNKLGGKMKDNVYLGTFLGMVLLVLTIMTLSVGINAFNNQRYAHHKSNIVEYKVDTLVTYKNYVPQDTIYEIYYNEKGESHGND